MTQLDHITWFSQIFWLMIIFSSVYIKIYQTFGPRSFNIQNTRVKKIEKHYSSIVFYDYLNADVLFKRYNLIFNNF
jgi:hypothetical protein